MFRNRGIQFNSLSIIEIEPSIKISRREEIEEWINKNQYDCNDLLIIDDDKSLNELPIHLKNRLILTNSYIGLNNMDELEQIVGGKRL